MFYHAPESPGHVAERVDTSNTMLDSYEYTPFRETITATEGVAPPLRYGAREWDRETGLYFMRARYYDPALGRFLSEDPIGLAGGINPYVFAGDNPVNGGDPSGLGGCSYVSGQYTTEVIVDGHVGYAVHGYGFWVCESDGGGGSTAGGEGWGGGAATGGGGTGGCFGYACGKGVDPSQRPRPAATAPVRACGAAPR